MGETDPLSESEGRISFSKSILVDFAFEIPTSLKFEVISIGGLSDTDERVLGSSYIVIIFLRSKVYVHVC
jgi:hypothetical protein